MRARRRVSSKQPAEKPSTILCRRRLPVVDLIHDIVSYCRFIRHLVGQALLSGYGRWRLAVGDQGTDVLNRQSRIILVKSDRGAVCPSCKVDEFLQIFSAWRGRRVLRELEYQVEDGSEIFGEVGNVLVK